MIAPSITTSAAQAMSGRFLSASADLYAWETDSFRRCTELVRAFQNKSIDLGGLHAALAGERLGSSPPTPQPGIAILGLFGVLSPGPSVFTLFGAGTSLRHFQRELTVAMFDRSIKAIVVAVDSPGGSVRLVAETAALMRAARQKKPTVAAVLGTAASAGFWIASNATCVECTASGSVGGVGVLAERLSLARHLEQEGVAVHVITAGRFKHENHPALAPDAAELKAIQQRVDSAYTSFVSDIAAGRHVPVTAVRGAYGEGRLCDAPDALRLGMIDKISTADATIARALTSPTDFASAMTARIEQRVARIDRDRRDRAQQEIAEFRARIHRSAMR